MSRLIAGGPTSRLCGAQDGPDAGAVGPAGYGNPLRPGREHPVVGAMDWNGFPDPHVRQGSSVASSVTPADGEPAETKKALYVVASSRVPRVRRGVRRF
jgi:hypothetical protein